MKENAKMMTEIERISAEAEIGKRENERKREVNNMERCQLYTFFLLSLQYENRETKTMLRDSSGI